MPKPKRNNPPRAIRRIVHFDGDVQGVGFRYTTCQISKGFNVSGYVKNLLDGRVKIVAEGWPDEVDRFVAAVEEPLSGYIEYTNSTDTTATGEFASFGIEY